METLKVPPVAKHVIGEFTERLVHPNIPTNFSNK